MERLYKATPAGLQYWECWEAEAGQFTLHWGDVGDRGQATAVSAAEKTRLMAERVAAGFAPPSEDDWTVLSVEYGLAGRFASSEELDLRHDLEDRLGETLGWTGLGFCDGGSSGMGTMEVCLFVIDAAVAERVIRDDLAGTRFAGYSRIFAEQ